jgi:hypothetical protein
MAEIKPSPCTKSAWKAIGNILLNALERGGWELYDALAKTYNAFISLVVQTADAVVAVIEPLLTIDQFIYDNFVKPPLQSVKALAKTVTQTVKIPAQTMGVTSGACKQESDNKSAIQRIEQYVIQDLDWLGNKIDNFEYHHAISQKSLDALKKLPSYMNNFKMPLSSELGYSKDKATVFFTTKAA